MITAVLHAFSAKAYFYYPEIRVLNFGMINKTKHPRYIIYLMDMYKDKKILGQIKIWQ